MSKSCEPNNATVTPSIGMEILHFSFVFPIIQREPKAPFGMQDRKNVGTGKI
jgi:hypothetical protein